MPRQPHLKRVLTKTRCLAWVLFGLAQVVFTAPVWAGGLFITEFGQPNMGVAGAGSQAVANDASTAFLNGAGMTRLKGNDLMMSGGLGYANVQFDPDTPPAVAGDSGGQAGAPFPILGTFYVHSLTDDVKIGASLTSISGASLDYTATWTGRYQSRSIELLTVNFNPEIAVRLNKWISVSAGLQVMYADLNLKVKGPPPPVSGTGQVKIDGDDITTGFDVAALFEVSERTRVGVKYGSKLQPDFSGKLRISGPGITVGSDTTITFPQRVATSIYHEINDKFALLGTLDWEDWSEFQNINIAVGSGGLKIPRNWQDTYKFAGGVHYRPSNRWLLQAGFAYDTSPWGASNRTPDMPIGRQIRYAVGVQHPMRDDLTVGAQFVYVDLGDAKINNSLAGGLKGKYSSNDLFILAFNANWKL